jgi:two-component system LytT family response regulator
MINSIIIEDELPAREKLISILEHVTPEVNVIATFGSVKESVDHLKNKMPVDLIFCDVQLPDGLSFEIFSAVNISTPVIFITGYDKFTLDAFDNNGIEYLLKPINNEDVARAITKYKKLEKHFSVGGEAIKNMVGSISMNNRTRLLVKKGIEHISIKFEDIVVIYTENRVTYVLDNVGKKYLSDKSLNELEVELCDSIFFRANRQCIINLNFIKCFKPYEKVKLQVELTVPHYNQFIAISQKSAPDFRNWITKW